ncbi:Pertussis toxin, subunit 1 [Sanguibacter keddieii DSM 10542]|uniref:Pertussis toxin, subunit 1 n=1 Tax=Sanguibacter keddieii (strain ATCC 51767 / DSM 10542 / NCFB 3025 / ST-74) TaxID=446469 RepID=D1BFG1_SANKS|nr:Pertussis toxin subunit 1 [Sanguibacter keddieii]ACZ23464.1 Pertussis toxin, subunit 1 [Sanguibacter keddieii DSM 10542]
MVDSILRQNLIARVLAIILTAALLGLVVPVAAPAASAPRLDLPPGCSAPPVCTFRVDTRPPEVVFAEGFTPLGDRDQLLAHAVGYFDEGLTGSAFVSTVSDLDLANVMMRGRGESFWVYAVWRSENFFSLNSSLEAFAGDLQDAGRAADADRVLELLNQRRAFDEWSALGGIPAEHVIGAFPRQSPVGDWHGWVENPDTIRPVDLPPAEPYGIDFAELDLIPPCRPGSARAGACSGPTTEEELADFHDAFDATSGEVRFTAFPDELSTDSKTLLGPLSESNEALRAFDASAGAGGFADLRLALAESIPADLARLEAVTASDTLISKVMETVGRSVDVGSELIPYLGVAATGYALREDVDHGNWADVGFDSVALALQSIEMVQPELAVFVEPVLLADLAVQWIVDRFRPGPAPAPAPDLGHLWEMYDELDSVPEALERALTTVRVQHLGDAFQDLRQEHLEGTLDPRLAADLDTLERMRFGYVLAAVRHAVDAGDGVSIPTGQIREHQLGLLAEIETAFDDAARHREEQYRIANDAQMKASVRHTAEASGPWTQAYDSLLSAFRQQVAVPHLRGLETAVWEEQRRVGTNVAIAYPGVCFVPTHPECVGFRQKVIDDRVDIMVSLHSERDALDQWWTGVPDYLAGDRPGAVWPADFVDFSSDPQLLPAQGRLCAPQGHRFSPNGNHRIQLTLCADTAHGAPGAPHGRTVVRVSGTVEYRNIFGGWRPRSGDVVAGTVMTIRKHGVVAEEARRTVPLPRGQIQVLEFPHSDRILGGYPVNLSLRFSEDGGYGPSQNPSDIYVNETFYFPAGPR